MSMAEPLEKQLITAFSAAWGATAPSLLGCASTLGLLAQREAHGDEVRSALEAAQSGTTVFAVQFSGLLTGLLLCLLDSAAGEGIVNLVRESAGGNEHKDDREFIGSILGGTAERLSIGSSSPLNFGEVAQFDFSSDSAALVSRLAAATGQSLWVNTFSLAAGAGLNSQLVMVYAAKGSLAGLLSEASAFVVSEIGQAAAAAASSSIASTRPSKTGGEATRNLERLLDVELEVVVRFGLTQMPLRELTRIGVGSLIELNRQVDEPVELLVNNRLLARGSVVVVDGYYGVRITEISQPEERSLSLKG